MNLHSRAGRAPLRGLLEYFVMATLAALAGITPAPAGLNPGSWELGFDYGVTDLDSDLGGDRGDRLSVRLGWCGTEVIEFEGQIMLVEASENLVPGIDRETTLTSAFFNVVLNIPTKGRAAPYGILGLGLTDVDLDVLGFESDALGLAYQLGFGSRFFFHKQGRTAFRLELSFIEHDAFDDSFDHLMLTGGFTWRIGKF